MPYPKEHAARLANPDKFKKFARKNDEMGSGIDAVYGITKDGKTELQAIRFDASKFTIKQVRKWLAEHDKKPILLEPATDKEKQSAFLQFAHTNEIAPTDPEWQTIDKSSIPREAYADMGQPEDEKTWLYPHHYVAQSTAKDVHGKPSHGKLVIHQKQLMAAYKQALKDKARPAVIEHFDAHWRAVDPDKDGTFLKPEVGSNQPYQKAEAPAFAFRHVAPFKLSADAQATGSALSIVALCGRPLEHPTWGKIVQDLSGMTHKERILVDYNHEAGQLLGYVDKFDVTQDCLQLSGMIVPQLTHQRSDEIIRNMAAGMPYEASIFFAPSTPDDIEVEDLPVGKSDVVNGNVVTGPIRIFRKWPLRGVAVCPYGLDSQTAAFAQSANEQNKLVQFAVRTAEGRKENDEMKMAEKLAAIHKLFGLEPGAKDAELAALLGEEVEAEDGETEAEGEETEVEVEVKKPEGSDTEAKCQGAPVDSKADLKKFVQAFGHELAAKYILEDKSFEVASAEYMQKLREENAALKSAAAKPATQAKSVAAKFDADSASQASGLPSAEKAKLDKYAQKFGLSAERVADLEKRRLAYEQKIKSLEGQD